MMTFIIYFCVVVYLIPIVIGVFGLYQLYYNPNGFPVIPSILCALGLFLPLFNWPVVMVLLPLLFLPKECRLGDRCTKSCDSRCQTYLESAGTHFEDKFNFRIKNGKRI